MALRKVQLPYLFSSSGAWTAILFALKAKKFQGCKSLQGIRGHQLPEALQHQVQFGEYKKAARWVFSFMGEGGLGSNLAERIHLEKEGSLGLNPNF